MKPDPIAAMRAWLDGIAALAVARCWETWSTTNPAARLYLWYLPAGAHSWGKFAVAARSPGERWELATAGIFPAGMERTGLQAHVRASLGALPVCNPDLDAMPPAPRLEAAPAPATPPAPTPEPPRASEPPRPANAPEQGSLL